MRFLAITAGGDFHPAPRTIAAGTKQPDNRVLFATPIRRRNDLLTDILRILTDILRIRDKTRDGGLTSHPIESPLSTPLRPCDGSRQWLQWA
jgi:hypothetical protein